MAPHPNLIVVTPRIIASSTLRIRGRKKSWHHMTFPVQSSLVCMSYCGLQS